MLTGFTLLFLPVFAIVFLIAWLSSRARPNFFKITFWATLAGAAVFCAIYAAVFVYAMSPHVDEHFKTPLTVEQARQFDCPIPLPDSAHNIRFAHAYGGVGAFEILVRFEAPVDVCRSHVQTVVDAWNRQDNMPSSPVKLSPITLPLRIDGPDILLRSTAWFDKEKIIHGETDSDGNRNPAFWIDTDRSVFYCRITDN